jgi:hypothetical protein
MSGKSLMHDGGESSDRIVPTKSANKGRELSAEQVEGRRSAKEIPRYGPMLDTVPGNTGALSCQREHVQPERDGRAYLQGGNRVRYVASRIMWRPACNPRRINDAVDLDAT